MRVEGSMTAAIQELINDGIHLALLVIDEDDGAMQPGEVGYGPAHILSAEEISYIQQHVIMFMQRMGCPVWSIRFLEDQPAEVGGDADNTRIALRALYGEVNRLRKPHPNAFRETTLRAELQGGVPVTHLVIMGFNANACVHATVGNRFWAVGTADDGATHLGFTVLTCDDVLHGGRANWPDYPADHYARLRFYSHY